MVGITQTIMGNKDFIKFETGLICMALALLLFAFCSCTKTEYITVEKVRTDTTYVAKVQKDSIWLHDSIFVKEWMAGDTVYRDRIQWHTKYVSKLVHDTLVQHQVDSIPVPYPITEYVEKKLSTWQVILMTIGTLTLMGIIVFVVLKLKRFLPCR